MNYLSKLLAFIAEIPTGNVPDNDVALIAHRGIKEAIDAGLIDDADRTQVRLHKKDSSGEKGYAIIEQGLFDNLLKENENLKLLKEEYQAQARRLRQEVEDSTAFIQEQGW